MGMSMPYETSGRTRQKLRTRDTLIAATRALISNGVTPRVEDAAAEAEISRTTAYRYFPNQRALLIAAHPEIDRKSLLSATPSRDPAARLDAVLDEFIRIVLETEAQLRMALRLSLEPGPTPGESPLRSGRAIGWLEDALAPVAARLSAREMRRLVYAIRSSAGIEALVWLTDVARLSRPEAAETMKWSAQALLRAALAGARRRKPRR